MPQISASPVLSSLRLLDVVAKEALVLSRAPQSRMKFGTSGGRYYGRGACITVYRPEAPWDRWGRHGCLEFQTRKQPDANNAMSAGGLK